MRNQAAVAEHAELDPCLVRRVYAESDLLILHHLEPKRYPHLLESAAAGTEQGRFDILFAFPGETLELPAEVPTGSALGHAGFLEAFDRWWRREAVFDRPAPNLPFRGGWFVYLGYELAGEVEPTLVLPPPAGAAGARLPTALATRIPAAVIRDRLLGQTLLVAEATHAALLDVMAGDLARAAEVPVASHDSYGPDAPGGAVLSGALDEDAPARYLDGVRRVRDYIFAGDVFQVNLSREWRGELNRDLSHGELYARLRAQNPGPFAGLASWGETAILSSSPERLVQVQGGLVQTRPIAGTRPRGFEAAADRALGQELLAHPKERAEHIMLVDLERNDLSRVCVPGSVKVDEFMVLESYAHVHHIVSNVRGELADGISPGQVLAALFPGGTITGCPKVRCMEIIAELEGTGRGPYTGSMGYIDRNGGMDLNILIRTMVREGARVSLRTGAGIVADSEPQRELEETRDKARGLHRALGFGACQSSRGLGGFKTAS